MQKLALAAVLASTALAPLAMTRDGEFPEQTLTRDLQFEVRAETIDEEARTVELSFSSEEPYERWWGTEILDHGKSAVRLGRLNGSAALLVNHDSRDQVGVVVKAWIKGRQGRAVVRFGKSQRAEEVFQDVKDGIRKLVSVGYRIISIVLDKKSQGEGETYRVTEWEPYEISLVAVPADATIGVGRDGEPEAFDPRTLVSEEEEDMNRFQRRDGAPAASPVAAPAAPAVAPAPVAAAPAQRDDATVVRAAAEAERERITTIRAIGERLGARELATAAIDGGHSLEQFVRDFEERSGQSRPVQAAEDPALGLSDRERRSYSFVRLLNAIANPTSRAAQEAAAFEFECSAAAQEQRAQRAGNSELRGFTVPVDVLRSPIDPAARRDLTVGTATAGGHTVATDLLASSFIEMLRNRMALDGLGARTLTDLSGNLAIPRMTGGATAYWVAESGSPTESQQAFDQVALSPKTLGAFTDISRKLLIQSSLDVEALVRSDLAATVALEIDRVGINGSGSSNQPRGIMQTSGIGSVAGGTNGAAPTFDHMVDLESAVAVANADVGNLAYLTNPKVRGKLKKTQQFSGTNGVPVWGNGSEPLNGYRAGVSNQVPSNLTKGTSSGVCSAILFGNFADLIIGMWSGLDLLVDPYTSSTSGTVRIVALQDVDVAVRHAESFAAMLDALTA